MKSYLYSGPFWLICLLCLFSAKANGQTLSDYYPTVEGELIKHTYYSLDYDEATEQANWVIYFAGLQGSAKRKNNFRADPKVSTLSASLDDYAGSGYDRGHLAPAADLSLNTTSMSESFYLSNMSPQAPSFNRGIWKKLEALVRSWSLMTDSKFDLIITGPVPRDSCGMIGNGVLVPCSYYKIYADLNTAKAVGFILENKASSEPLSNFVASIDEIEKETGIDFFHYLPDDQEEQLESQKDASSWDWKAKYSIKSTKSQDIKSAVRTKCKANTKSGKRCSRNSGNSGYCWQHEGN